MREVFLLGDYSEAVGVLTRDKYRAYALTLLYPEQEGEGWLIPARSVKFDHREVKALKRVLLEMVEDE